MEKKDKNNNKHLQRIKQINKSNNLNYTEYLVKYFPENKQKENRQPIICIEREINIPKKLANEIMTEEEKVKLCKSMKEKFEKEMKLITKFSHPNIVKVIDYFKHPENVFHIIYENYQCDLSNFMNEQLNKKKYFNEAIILSFFTQICLGIKYIHDKNILHRNINPSNILLISNKIVKISNFDVSRILYTSREKSITLIKNSWKDYISPEMGLEIPYSFKNDIWSLGILLFHMMALKVPFDFKQLNEIQTIKKVDSVYLMNKIPKHFSKDIKNLCVDLLKAYPAERPDINTILSKYRIIKNEIMEISRKIGGKITISNNIKNLYRADPKTVIKEKNQNNNHINQKKKIWIQYINIGVDKKKEVNSIKKYDVKKEEIKLPIYEKITEIVKDPNNVMGRDYIEGEIISIHNNEESIYFKNLMNVKNSNKSSSNNNNNKESSKEI